MQFSSDDVFSSRLEPRLGSSFVFHGIVFLMFHLSSREGGEKVGVTELQLKRQVGTRSRSPDKRLIGDFSRGFLDRDSVATLRNSTDEIEATAA